jgi:serine/threonine protein kinase
MALATEAKILGRISHPAVPMLFDFRRIHGRLTLVQERVDGVTLARLLQGPPHGPLLPAAARLFLVHRLFDALAALHDAVDPVTFAPSPAVHGEVSPRTLLVPRDGYAKLVDFGRASFVASATRIPEGIDRGRELDQTSSGGATPAADVYAACVVARELLAERSTFSVELDAALRLGLSLEPGRGRATARSIADLAWDGLAPGSGRAALADAVNATRSPSTAAPDDDITVRAPFGAGDDDTPTMVVARPLL